MSLKKTILAVMSPDDLKAAVEAASLEQVDRRSVQSMRDALARSRRVRPDALLAAMTEGQVKAVCERTGIDPTGRKTALTQRLLASQPKPRRQDAPTPALADAPAVAEPAPERPPPAKISVAKTELVWPGKYNEDGTLREAPRVTLPFQVIETVNESRATRAAKATAQPTLFDVYQGDEGDTFEDGWRNKLIWGDNLLVMGSLLEKFAGKVDLIYIDPPFATGADFSFEAQIGSSGDAVYKEQSILEEKAYRDTWSGGLSSYVSMLHPRIDLMRSLLSRNGSLVVHVDPRVDFAVRALLDEAFGSDGFRNLIVWKRDVAGKGAKRRSSQWPRNADTILWYSRSQEWYFEQQYTPLQQEQMKAYRYKESSGRRYKAVQLGDYSAASIAAFEKQGLIHTSSTGKKYKKYYLDEAKSTVDCIWTDVLGFGTKTASHELSGYPTQKPEKLLERIVESSCVPGGLVADFFCGSGTTMVVSEKTGRRWIGCDLGRWGVHTTRKRLLGIENCKPFDVLNLGKYERQYWQGTSFAASGSARISETALYEYLAFILKLYGARPVAGLAHLHGQKNRALVHIGAVDAPVTIGDVNAAVDECVKLKQKELHVLGWEWEMGLNDLMANAARAKGVKLLSLQIPREVMEQQAVDQGDVRFFELAYLKATVETPRKLTARVKLDDFVIPNPELIPADVRSKVTKWSDYIDYWAVDWNFQHDTFMQGWVTYRTRRDRSLALVSDAHTYAKAGTYRALVKVIDIFGNDTSQLLDVQVK